MPSSSSPSPYRHPELSPQLQLQLAEDDYLPQKRKKKGDNWKGNKSMQHVTLQQIEAARSDLGVLLPYVRRMTRTRDRRMYLAMLSKKKHTRAAVCHALDMKQKINDTEWKEIGIHARYPGPLQPVPKTQIFRSRVPQAILLKLLNFLEDPGNLQKFAFGTMAREILGGTDYVELDKVERMQKLQTLATKFILGLNSEMENMESLLPHEERCEHVNRNTFCRCRKKRNHTGKCKWTPKGSICETTAKNLIESMTGNDMIALCGLDDTKVEKGRDNFIALRDMADDICNTSEEAKVIKDGIDEVEIFHQSNFMQHLQQNGTHECNCLTCGFYNKKQPNDIVCQHVDSHQPSCEQCSKGFAIILQLQEQITEKYEEKQKLFQIDYNLKSLDDLQIECNNRDLPSDGTKADLVLLLQENDNKELEAEPLDFSSGGMKVKHMRAECKKRKIPSSGNRDDLMLRLMESEEDIAKNKPKYKLRTLNTAERMELDLLEEQLYDIGLRKQDFVEYRSHLARHQAEDDYAKLELENLEDDEAIVTCDYKMKLLACFLERIKRNGLVKEVQQCLVL